MGEVNSILIMGTSRAAELDSARRLTEHGFLRTVTHKGRAALAGHRRGTAVRWSFECARLAADEAHASVDGERDVRGLFAGTGLVCPLTEYRMSRCGKQCAASTGVPCVMLRVCLAVLGKVAVTKAERERHDDCVGIERRSSHRAVPVSDRCNEGWPWPHCTGYSYGEVYRYGGTAMAIAWSYVSTAMITCRRNRIATERVPSVAGVVNLVGSGFVSPRVDGAVGARECRSVRSIVACRSRGGTRVPLLVRRNSQ